MKLWLLRVVMQAAWAVDEVADDVVAWAEQNYSNEVYGLGRID